MRGKEKRKAKKNPEMITLNRVGTVVRVGIFTLLHVRERESSYRL